MGNISTGGKRPNIRVMTVSAMLAAVSAVLMFIEFPIPIFPSFLKFDFSDLPALIGAFSFGPIAGLAIELIKNLFHLLRTQTGGVGELANFIVGCALVLPAAIVYRKWKTRRGAVIGIVAGIVVMAIAAAFANYYITLPFFTSFMPIDAIIEMCAKLIPAVDSKFDVVLLSIVPFNLMKGVVICLITFLLYKHLSRLIHKQ
jgi:riboflavin transporter FmnP